MALAGEAGKDAIVVIEAKTDASVVNESKLDLVVPVDSGAHAAVAAGSQPNPTGELVQASLPAYLAQDACRLHAAAYRGDLKLMAEILKADNARISSRKFVTYIYLLILPAYI